MAPLLLIAAGLIVVFRANLWNLGIDGQFLLAAVIISGVGPALDASLPNAFTLLFLWLALPARSVPPGRSCRRFCEPGTGSTRSSRR